MKKSLLISFTTTFALLSSASALTIANFEFDDLSSSDSGTTWTTSTTTGVGDADGIQNHGIVSDIANPGSSYALSMGDINSANTGDVNYAPFFEFTVTPSGGEIIDFSLFGIDLYKSSGGADVVATLKWSVDSYAASLATATVSDTGSWLEASEDISSLASINSATTFRVEMFTTGGSPGNEIRVDNIVLEAIPEPSSVALLGLGGLALLFRRRR